jgi:hypothetical protein
VKLWQKLLIMTAVTVAIGGIYLFVVWHQRQDEGVVTKRADPDANLTPDDVAIVRVKWMTSFDDTESLVGTSVWMKKGYVMPYYPFAGGRVEFSKPAGLIPAAQRLDVKKIVKAAAPASVDDGISHGSRQVFAVFALPGGPDGNPAQKPGSDAQLYATAIGAIQGDQEFYLCDNLFYYDDPHTIYDNWPHSVWTVIDAHQVQPGMSELETQMSLGQTTESDGGSKGNRDVTYDVNGKKWTVTFKNNHATTIKSQ